MRAFTVNEQRSNNTLLMALRRQQTSMSVELYTTPYVRHAFVRLQVVNIVWCADSATGMSSSTLAAKQPLGRLRWFVTATAGMVKSIRDGIIANTLSFDAMLVARYHCYWLHECIITEHATSRVEPNRARIVGGAVEWRHTVYYAIIIQQPALQEQATHGEICATVTERKETARQVIANNNGDRQVGTVTLSLSVKASAALHGTRCWRLFVGAIHQRVMADTTLMPVNT